MKLLTDSDFLISLVKLDDANHNKSIQLFKKIEKSDLTALNLVMQESTTVMSKRWGMIAAKTFYGKVTRLIQETILLNEEIEHIAWKIFLSQTKKGTSFIDCANMATCEYYKLDGILSFDEVYKDKRIKT